MAYPPEARSVRRLGVLALLAALLLVAPGCSYPRALRTYEYVVSYERMTDSYDPLVSLVYVPRSTSLQDYRGIVIGDIEIGNHWVNEPEGAERYAEFFRVSLRRELLRRERFEFVSLDVEEPPGPGEDDSKGVLRLDGMITRLDAGSGWKRYLSFFLWLLQSGATDLQIEGRITEADSGRLVAEFVDRRRHLCNTPFGPNPHNFDDAYAMNITAHWTAECLADFIDQSYLELPAVDAHTPDNDSSECEG